MLWAGHVHELPRARGRHRRGRGARGRGLSRRSSRRATSAAAGRSTTTGCSTSPRRYLRRVLDRAPRRDPRGHAGRRRRAQLRRGLQGRARSSSGRATRTRSGWRSRRSTSPSSWPSTPRATGSRRSSSGKRCCTATATSRRPGGTEPEPAAARADGRGGRGARRRLLRHGGRLGLRGRALRRLGGLRRAGLAAEGAARRRPRRDRRRRRLLVPHADRAARDRPPRAPRRTGAGARPASSARPARRVPFPSGPRRCVRNKAAGPSRRGPQPGSPPLPAQPSPAVDRNANRLG